MNQQLQELQTQIAQGIWRVMPEHHWIRTVFVEKAIKPYFHATGNVELANGQISRVNGVSGDIFVAFRSLRPEMAKLHDNGHAWYTATFTLTTDGKFKFDFDYDHLPAFDIMPSPDKWLDEFKHYPRPELQALIQDWIDGEITYDDDDEVAYAALIKRLKDASAP
ncbi:DUF600 family protein [Azoarcus sp. L1K30]|uniref:immunity protein YezG family protein n=1 Tax=Azoarcus sp. L1K30 TaxID=2820277 RepID=UPI001B83DE77|nr:immunity protein YezG family protein [Azoarcus sp. L1K30]MBR0565980.1 DUF600 family protein [Azoarcus sp. L1K30]